MRELAKKVLHKFRRSFDIEAPPKRIDVEITNVCNFNCSVCTTGNKKNNRPKANLTPGAFQEIIAKLDEKYLESLNLNCIGEPFINKHIYDILAIAGDLGMQVSVQTNASLIEPEKLKNLPQNINLKVSLDGVDFQSFNGYRNTTEDVFNRVINNLQEMSELGIPFTIISLVSRHNEDSLDEIKAFVDKLGVPYRFNTITCSPFGVTQDMLPKSVKMEDNWVGRKYITPQDYAELAQSRELDESAVKYVYDQELDLYVNPHTPTSCPFVNTSWICADGMVLPCCFEAYYSTVEFGNIFQVNNFKEIWLSPEYIKFRRGMLGVSRSFHGPCRICTKK